MKDKLLKKIKCRSNECRGQKKWLDVTKRDTSTCGIDNEIVISYYLL